MNLIPRFYDATGGTVSIGGVDVRRMQPAELRAMLGYVPQKGVLFTGDILSNLEFAGDVSEADAIRAAAKAAGQSVQAYVLQACEERMKREGRPLELDSPADE